ncbi:MAG: hypothetical protein Q8R28_08580 [Dehalococcoidia bacterium]|nr:hypothetical protein [Dehalococcoidia bacterium]
MTGRGAALTLVGVLAVVLVGCRPSGIGDAPAEAQPPREFTAISLPSRGIEESGQPIAEPSILSCDAAQFIGQTRTVCGPVVDTRYVRSRGRPTFMYFDKPQPDNTFLVLIWGADRRKFPANPEDYYKGKTICVDGLIHGHSSGPFMEVDSPSQISLQ